MRVLLISPLPALDPPCGDVTYTETLLASPPPGVEYVNYAEALADGSLREHARRSSLHQDRSLRGWGLLAREAVLNRARGAGLLFREPFRFFSVAHGAYDLVHCHMFHARIDSIDNLPLVVSNGAPQVDLYTDAFGWSPARVRVAAWCDRKLARALHVNQTTLSLEQADRVVCFTEHLRDWLVSRNVVPQDFCSVVAVGTALGPTRPPRLPRRVGFVGTDFDSKGGELVLAAYDIARRERPDLELLIIGSPARLSEQDMARRSITWLPRVPRQELLDVHFPSMDVFAYPTNFDGPSLVLQEALSFGVPAAVSDYGAMPEMVQHGRAGLVSPQNDIESLAGNMLRLLDPREHEAFRAGVQAVFLERYELNRAHARLAAVYAAALTEHASAGSGEGRHG